MEAVILVLMLVVIFMTWVKLTFLKAWQVAVVAVICALFIGLTWNFAIARSRNEISAWLGNQQLMLDTSVVLTLEVIWQMAYCMLSGKLIYDGKVSRRFVHYCLLVVSLGSISPSERRRLMCERHSRM